MKKIGLHWQVLIAIILATIAGQLTSNDPKLLGIPWLSVFDFLGTIFMNALMMVIVPLITSSIICGIANMGGSKDMGRMLGKTLGFYLLTSFLAICLGLVIANVIKPGIINGEPARDQLALQVTGELDNTLENVAGKGTGDIIDVFVRMVPTNIIEAAATGEMLALIFFSMLFGFLMTKLEKNKFDMLITFWQAIQDVMMNMTMLIMRFAPIGVFGLVATTISETGVGIFLNLGWFFLTVSLALGIHMLVTLSFFLRLRGINPFKHLHAMRDSMMMCFSTASSVASLPITIGNVESTGVSRRITAFTLPLGATINMNGTALYECVAAIFIAQAYGLDLTITTQFTIVMIALLTSIGVAGIPAASLVAITIILVAIGLPVEAIGLLMVTDRILDMMRTVVNVYGDSVAAVVIARSEGETLNTQIVRSNT